MELKNGGPAFPSMGWMGMSLRDYFAGQAMAGMLSTDIATQEQISDGEVGHPWFWEINSLAKVAYEIADAMLEQRTKSPMGVPSDPADS